ncbi:hypothetical protein BHE74_00007124 [Ensete ventricosum]|nr:hypothetical protein GW17_00019914 [Ensete ventricosum]RWW84274.1 hypothetical protein BHE74_00007124 [Ensete ventricosum]
MRLHHVELLDAFLLHFRSDGSEERGWPTTARPFARATGYGQAPVGATACGQATGAAPVASPHRGVAFRHGARQPTRCRPWAG